MALHKRKRTDGTFYPTFVATFQHRGKRVSADTGTTTQAEARKWIAARKREIEAEEASQRSTRRPKSLNVGTALARYWDEKLSLSRSANNEKYVLKKLGGEIGTELPLEEMTTAVLVPLVARKLKYGLAESTVVREMTILKAMHNHAREVWEYPTLRAIAWRRVMPRIPETEIVPPTPAEVRRLCLCASTRLASVILFAALTGLRLDEIKKLEWTNCHLEENPGKLRFTGKGKKTVTLPLSSAATSLLLSMPRGQSSRVFDMTNRRKEWDAARSKVGLSSTRFHDLRHAFATLFRAKTKKLHGAVDPMALKDAMRHSDIDTSLIYAHADKSDLLPSLEAVASEFKDLLTTSPSLPAPSVRKAGEEPTES